MPSVMRVFADSGGTSLVLPKVGELLWGTTNRETFRAAFLSRDSILWYLLKTHRRGQRRRAELVAGHPHVRLRSAREIDRYLREAV